MCKKYKISVIESAPDDNDFYVGSIERKVHELVSVWIEKLRVENKVIAFKLDSGASVNVLPEHIFREMKLINKCVKSCRGNLEAFGGYKISPTGTVDLMIEHKDGFYVEEFVLKKTRSSPILGFET